MAAVTLTGCRAPDGRTPDADDVLASGVSRELARHRADTLSELGYEIAFTVPEAFDEPIRGRETIRFVRGARAGRFVVDFQAPAERVSAVRTPGGAELPHRFENNHLVIEADALAEGEKSPTVPLRGNAVEIEFVAGEGSLNRDASYLYTLFVPDRAHHAFPCLDQPDLKASYRLTLDLPAAWEVAANAPSVEKRTDGGRTTWSFAETRPLPSYLFAFAAGEFEVEEAERGGRLMRMLHRETDGELVARNREAIFDLHAAALAWLEDYTGIAYPFAKFDFVLIPSFQYGGMEHPGSILYRASRLLLDESATQDDLLGRASLIAHETAHMWFGDLVTMPWFDDVWMKEVFANFMAAKIVHPSFPEIDHDLRFLLAHHPAAYAVDRSAGANPIRQELDNLVEAGSLYGAVIYQKAPVVMRQLEELVGEATLRRGLVEYLDRHRYGNAAWSDLIAILDALDDDDLAAWSRVWVGEPGRPEVRSELTVDDGRIASFKIVQTDPWERGRLWTQQLEVALGYDGGVDGGGRVDRLDVRLEGAEAQLEALGDQPAPDWVLAGSDGLGYAGFVLDEATRAHLLAGLSSLDEPILRGVAWLSLWDEMLAGRLEPAALFDTALDVLEHEEDALLVNRVLSDLSELYWRFLPRREDHADGLEALLRGRLEAAEAATLKASFYRAWVATATSAESAERLARISRRELEIPGLPLSEENYMTLAYELAVRRPDEAAAILAGELERIENPDRQKRFAFVTPALSADPAERDAFFESLRDVANRRQEPWVLEALGYLHHPLRAPESEKYILASLELVEEIQRTGDIFFPKRWLDVTLGGHSSPRAAETVRTFLETRLEARPDYPERLRGKILQAADGLFRAAR